MKKIKRVFAVVLCIMLLCGILPSNITGWLKLPDFSIKSKAEVTYTEGYYTYSVFDNIAIITGCDTAISGSVTIPSSLGGYPVTSIGDWAFFDCTSLTSVEIPDSVTSIGYSAFYNCTSLESITIPDSVTSIDVSAFENCTSLTSITIPDSVISIGEVAFHNCISLTSITIPDSVTSIASDAFSGCTSLESITIPDSVTYISNYAFKGCSSLNKIIVESGNLVYLSQNNCLIEKATNELVLGCKNSIIPDSVTSIGERAFSYCAGLTSITIPDSITSIGSYAFEYCDSLESVTIGNNVTSIGNHAFSSCDSFTSIYYRGTEEEKSQISIKKSGNEKLNEAEWYYNACIGTANHTFDNSCDTTCNVCGKIREITHIYEIIKYDKDNHWMECECGAKSDIKTHTFDKEVAEEKYLVSGVTCTAKAVYKKSCVCGLAGTETFEYGEMLAHTFDQEIVADKYLVSGATCTAKAVYKKSCTCGEAGTETFEYGEKLAHTFDKEVPEEKYLVSGATCTAKAVYKKSCTCGLAGTETFEYGEMLAHTFNQEVVVDKYLVSGATCTAKAVYKKSCVCGAAGTATFEYGNKLSHISDNGTVTKNATCAATGTKVYKCKTCKTTTKTETIAKVAHKYANVLTKAKINKNGSIVKKCSVCGTTNGTTIIYAVKTVKLAKTSYTYDGKAKKPTVTVKNSKGKTLKNKVDYTVTYASGRKNVGKYKVTIKFQGNYTGTKTLYFTINPPKTSVSKLTAAKKALTVSISKKTKQVTGYEIQYATNKKFSKAKTTTVKSYKTTKVTLKKLSAKKTYYVRVRTYKTVGKTKYYSGWSTVKYKKTK